jgi:hypothetical protein
MASVTKYVFTSVPVATAALVAGKNVMAIEIFAGAATGSVELKDALTDTGTVLFTATTPASTSSPLISFVPVGGISFTTGIFVKPAGTNCVVYIWTE